MLRSLSEDGVVHLKDRLRDVRRFIRGKRHDHMSRRVEKARPASPHLTPFHRNEVEGFLGYAASVTDDALTIAESVSLSLIPGARTGQPAPRSLNAYFPPSGSSKFDAERLFRRDMYRAAKAMPKTMDAWNAPIREAGFTSVHLAMRRRRQVLLYSLQTAPERERIGAVAAVCSALLLEMLKSQAADEWGALPQAERQFYCSGLAPLTLACGLATLSPDYSGTPDLLETSIIAIDARKDRLVRSLDGPQPFDDVRDLFTVLLAHMP